MLQLSGATSCWPFDLGAAVASSYTAKVTSRHRGAFARHWKEIAVSFLKLGATAYGGPAITGIIQTELQEKRQWVSKAHFVEGIALVNLLPGAGLVQLSTFLGHARGGWWGGLLAGLCFVLPGFGIMLGLTLTYAHLGAMPMVMITGRKGIMNRKQAGFQVVDIVATMTPLA